METKKWKIVPKKHFRKISTMCYEPLIQYAGAMQEIILALPDAQEVMEGKTYQKGYKKFVRATDKYFKQYRYTGRMGGHHLTQIK